MTVTAVDMLAAHTGGFAYPADWEKSAEGVDVERFLIDAVNILGLDFNVAGCILDGSVERSMDAASNVQVTVHDASGVLLGSKLWDYTVDVNLDGNWYQLVQVGKQGYDLTLTFEDRIVAWMRRHTKPLKVSRGKMTRAEFIKRMVDEIRADDQAGHPLFFYSPELHKRQPIAKPKKMTDRRSTRDSGLNTSVDLKVKGKSATGIQIRNAEMALDAARHKAANRKVMVAEIMTAIQESDLTTQATNGDHVGMFQQSKAEGWPASRDVTTDANAFVDAAMAADQANPNQTLAQLCEAVQHSGQGSLYAQWEDEAKKIVDEYLGGADISQTVQREYYKQYAFTRGQPGGPKGENTWQAGGRLASEVNWRFFVSGNTVYYVSDDDLLRSKPIMVIDEDSDGIETIDYDYDIGKPVNEATVTCRAERWFASPGEVVTLRDSLGPARGRWLVGRIHRPIFDTLTTITLRRPQKPALEPAPELASSSTSVGGIVVGGRVDAKSYRDRIVKAAQEALAIGPSKYKYRQVRPMPRSLFQAGTIYTDCSGFATLCYKAAGAGDPNGFGYDGQGYTGTLVRHGRRTGSPQPGDLVFYGSNASVPDHVAVYIGNGEVIQMGGDPDPTQSPVHGRGDFLFFMTYFLDPTIFRGVAPRQRHGGPAGP